MTYQLEEFIDHLHDPRRGQGQRHSLRNVLTIVIMAILSGYQGLRGFARFASANESELKSLLQLKHGVPCFFTFRAILNGLDDALLTQHFTAWVKTCQAVELDTCLALDGKAVSGSSRGGRSSLQNFVAVVSAFGHQSGLVYGMKSFENGKSSEAQALRDLVEQLGLQDKILTMDALHAQKKRSN